MSSELASCLANSQTGHFEWRQMMDNLKAFEADRLSAQALGTLKDLLMQYRASQLVSTFCSA